MRRMIHAGIWGGIFMGLLAGCATPLDRCVSVATKDLRVVEGLIAQTRGTLERGYAYDTVDVVTTQFALCPRRTVGPLYDAQGREVYGRSGLCERTITRTEQRPRAVDLGAERQKLDSLMRKRAQLSRAAEREIATCRATFPEG